MFITSTCSRTMLMFGARRFLSRSNQSRSHRIMQTHSPSFFHQYGINNSSVWAPHSAFSVSSSVHAVSLRKANEATKSSQETNQNQTDTESTHTTSNMTAHDSGETCTEVVQVKAVAIDVDLQQSPQPQQDKPHEPTSPHQREKKYVTIEVSKTEYERYDLRPQGNVDHIDLLLLLLCSS